MAVNSVDNSGTAPYRLSGIDYEISYEEENLLIGVVSDTHSYLNPRVPKLLQGVDLILHAGDIGDDSIISELRKIAPVTVVRGNNDREGPTSLYPIEATEELEGHRMLLTHEVKVPKSPDSPGMKDYLEMGVSLVVYGHSHIASQERRGPVLFFNPGAAGKRRFKVVPSIGFLTLENEQVEGQIVIL